MPYRYNPLPPHFDRVDGGGPAPDIETLTGDSGGAVPPTAGNINILGQPDINIAGNPGTSTLALTDLTKLSPYVVAPGVAGVNVAYSSIQDAINAVKTLFGAQVIYVRPAALYSENLDFTGFTFPCNVIIRATPLFAQSAIDGITIIGTHTPPDSGQIFFENLNLLAQTGNIFDSASAGSSMIWLRNCNTETTSGGYIFNLPNWVAPGIFVLENYRASAIATDNAVINNSGGAALSILDSSYVGTATGAVSTISGDTLIRNSVIYSPLNFVTGSSFDLNGSTFNAPITLSNNSIGIFTNCNISTGSLSGITMNSSAEISLVQCSIDTSNSNAIAGSGAGNLVLLNNTFVDNQQIVGTVVTPNLSHSVRGNGQTVGAVTADLITYTMPSVAATMVFDIRVSGLNSLTPAGNGYSVFGTVRTDGATASLVGTPDRIANEDAALVGAQCELVVSGNNAIVRVTGVAGLTVNWSAFESFTQVR